MIITLCGCSSVENDEFSSNKARFETIADFACSYYADTAAVSNHITLVFYDGRVAEIDGLNLLDIESVSDEVLEAIDIIENIGFEYLWVSDSYVIFWKDDLKIYGLLWSASPMKVIKEMKIWYSEMRYNKLEKEWYEIGTRGV